MCQSLRRGYFRVNTWMHKLKLILVQGPSLGPEDYNKTKKLPIFMFSKKL